MLNSYDIMTFVATAKPDQARHFYEQQLGLTFLMDEPFALVFEANGVPLRIQKMQSLTPAAHTTLGWTVPDIAAAVAELAAKGVQFTTYPGMGQNAAGIMTFDDGVQVAWFKDPDGNTLSLTQLAS